MKRRAVAAIVGVMALALVIAPGAWAQGPIDDELVEDILSGVTAEQVEYCDPAAGSCTYITLEDNENNVGTGLADNDMGGDGAGGYYVACNGDANYPIEFDVAISAITYNVDAILLMEMPIAIDPARIHSVYLNGTQLTDYWHATSTSGSYAYWVGRVDPCIVHLGDNLVEVLLRSGACVQLDVGILFMFDHEWLGEEFVPEPGSVLLLGSGLAGLAGYAALRWRTRE